MFCSISFCSIPFCSVLFRSILFAKLLQILDSKLISNSNNFFWLVFNYLKNTLSNKKVPPPSPGPCKEPSEEEKKLKSHFVLCHHTDIWQLWFRHAHSQNYLVRETSHLSAYLIQGERVNKLIHVISLPYFLFSIGFWLWFGHLFNFCCRGFLTARLNVHELISPNLVVYP